MHLLSAKKGSGNESSCSFRPPVFFQWSQDRTASSGFFFFFFFPGAGCVCQRGDGQQVYLSWQRWISQQRAGPVQLSCWGGAHTRADIKLFQEVISLLFFTKMPKRSRSHALVRTPLPPMSGKPAVWIKRSGGGGGWVKGRGGRIQVTFPLRICRASEQANI